MHRLKMKLTLTPRPDPVERPARVPGKVVTVPPGSAIASLVHGTAQSRGPSHTGPGPGRFSASGLTALRRPRALSRGSANLKQEVMSRMDARGWSCPAIFRKGEVAVGVRVEERASRFPWMGQRPPLHQAGKAMSCEECQKKFARRNSLNTL